MADTPGNDGSRATERGGTDDDPSVPPEMRVGCDRDGPDGPDSSLIEGLGDDEVIAESETEAEAPEPQQAPAKLEPPPPDEPPAATKPDGMAKVIVLVVLGLVLALMGIPAKEILEALLAIANLL